MLETSLLLQIPNLWLLLPGAVAYRCAPHLLKRALSKPLLIALAVTAMLVCRLAAGTAILLVQSFHWRLVLDAPLMHYIAWRMLNGAVPYRDIFDMNLPGAYLIHVAVLKIFGLSDIGWRLFDLTWLAGTSALLANYCRGAGAIAAGLSVLLFCAFHLSCGPTSMGQRDYLEFTFLLAGLSLAVKAWDNACDGRCLFGAGLALGFAASIKPTAVLLWLAIAAMSAAQAARQGRAWQSPAAAVLGGGFVLFGLFAAWLGAIGGLKPFITLMTGFVLPIYPKLHAAPFHHYLVLYTPIWLSALFVIASAVAAGRLDNRRAALAAGCLYGLAHYVLQGKGWLYHLYPLVGFSSALCACSFSAALRNPPRRSQWAQIAAAFCFILALADWSVRLQTSQEVEQNASATVAEMQRDLIAKVQPGDTVQPFDTAGGCVHAMLRTQIRMPTRYLYDFPCLTQRNTPYLRALRSQMLRDLQSARPTFLLVHRWGWPSGQYERLNNCPELARWILENYDLTTKRDHYEIYERRGRHRANYSGL